MSYIVLEGISIYIFLILIILLLIISLLCLICAVLSDKRNFVLGNLLSQENKKVNLLQRENFILKLKSGEFEVDEE